MNQSPKRIHKLLTVAVISGLEEVFFNNRKADQAVGELLRFIKKLLQELFWSYIRPPKMNVIYTHPKIRVP